MSISRWFAAAALMWVAMLCPNPARAQQNLVTFVSHAGLDTNDCTNMGSACLTFNHAYAQTSPGGTIYCLDSGDFGGNGLTITTSVTIDCTGANGKAIATLGRNAFNINGAGIVVIFRGLNIDGFGSSGQGAIGINVIQAAAVQLEGCAISRFQTDASQGIRIAPASGFTTVTITDTFVDSNGLGIFVLGGNGLLMTLKRVTMANNTFGGFRASGAGSGVFANIVDSIANNNGTNGFVATSPAGGSAVVLDIQHSGASLNQQAGILADGAAASITIGASTVTANSTGLARTNGGAILSYGDNRVDNNSSNGSPSGGVGTM